MGSSIDARTPSQLFENVSYHADDGDEHAELATTKNQATDDELQVSCPFVSGFLVSVDGHPIETDSETDSPPAIGSSKSCTQLIDELLVEAKNDMETITTRCFRRQLEQRMGKDLECQKEEINKLIRDRFWQHIHARRGQTSGTSATPADNKQLVNHGNDNSDNPAVTNQTDRADHPEAGDSTAEAVRAQTSGTSVLSTDHKHLRDPVKGDAGKKIVTIDQTDSVDGPSSGSSIAVSRLQGKRKRHGQSLGMVGVNTGVIAGGELPFGGVKQSGFGKEGGKWGVEEFMVTKCIVIAV